MRNRFIKYSSRNTEEKFIFFIHSVGSHWLDEMILNVANPYLLYVIGLLV